MRCCTRVLLALLLLTGGVSFALTADHAAPVSLAEIEEFKTKGIPDEQWPALLEVLGNKENGNAARMAVLGQAPLPTRKKLVEMLVFPKLAVRLGALDLLEEIAGETFGFDPWSEEPAGGANAEALVRWREWVTKGAESSPTASAGLSAESFRSLAMEIVSGQRDRAERAMQRLEVFGPSAIGHLEALLQDQPTLEEGARAMLKAAEYRVILRKALPPQAAALSRQLATGAPDTQATALPLLAEGGPAVLPIIADLLGSPDPLVRETAVDAAFKAGADRAVDLVLPMLKSEKAESVLHTLLRNVGEHAATPEQAQAILPFLVHPTENVAISAADALGRAKNGDSADALAARLADGRWRVRAAAVEAIGKRKFGQFADRVEKLMDDPDQFVRVTAAETYRELAGPAGEPVLLARFNKQDELRSTILNGFLSGQNSPPAELWKSLADAPPAIILECLDSLEERGDHEGKRIVYAARFSSHPNPDVAAAALRLLAGHGKQTGELLKALKSPQPAIRDAVLDQLQLPPGFLRSAPPATPGAPPAPHSLLDKLYDSLAGSRKEPAKAADEGVVGDPREFRTVLEGFFRDGSPRQRFRAALVLASQGDRAGAEFLLANLGTLSALDRRSIAGSFKGLSEWPPGAPRDLMTKLLADPANDVRETVIEAWLGNATSDRLAGILAELRRPGTLLRPDDLYDYYFDRALQNYVSHVAVLEWSTAVLDDPASLDSNKVLAMIMLNRSSQTGTANLARFLTADNQWLRRAAYRALGLNAVELHLAELLHDDSAMVRAVVPFLASPHSSGWLHWFDDAHSAADHEDFRDNSTNGRRGFGAWAKKGASPADVAGAPSAAVLTALETLTKDPSELVRFEAFFALLRLGRPIDVDAFAALVPAQSEESEARYRLGQFLSARYQQLDKSYGVLVPLATKLDVGNRGRMEEHFGLNRAQAPISFASLALAPAGPAAEAPVEPVAPVAPPRTFRVVFFHKVGCRDCERVRQMLAEQSQHLPNVVIEEHDIAEGPSVLLNETLAARFKIPDHLHLATPAVFTQAGTLIRDEITFPKLGDLLRLAAAQAPDERWLQADTAAIQTAQSTIVQRYDALSLSVVLFSGLLDGISPCAMATIIFLLSYMQVARRAPGEILAVGSAFVFSVFATYFVIGLGLAEVLGRLAAVRFAGALLNYTLAAFALLLAVLSFRDATLAAQGQAGEMSLQLPDGLKSRIRGVIRSGAGTPRFVVAALFAGVFISLLELACTGQVYLPTIQYMLRGGRAGAAWPLLLYNVAFILPLIVVFALAWAGLRSETLARLQQRHTALVKVLTGLLFLALTLLLLFAYRPVVPSQIGGQPQQASSSSSSSS